jgi:hypothetical protein
MVVELFSVYIINSPLYLELNHWEDLSVVTYRNQFCVLYYSIVPSIICHIYIDITLFCRIVKDNDRPLQLQSPTRQYP